MSPLHLLRFPYKKLGDKNPTFGNFSDNASTFAISFGSAKKFYNFKDVQSICEPNLLGDGTYSKKQRLSVKFSFMLVG